jgi:hypothetical protein
LIGDRLDKYASSNRFRVQGLADASTALGKNASVKNCVTYSQLMNSSLSKSSWAKYSSALNAFACFEKEAKQISTWPLDIETCRSFVIWCHSVRKLPHSSIKSYLSGIKFVHNLRGFPCHHISEDFIISQLLKGAEHISMAIPSSNTRRVVTFPLLTNLGSRIAATDWDPLTKQVFWAASTCAFFGTLRMGEILASSESAHSPASDLTWADVKASSPSSILIRVKQPKSGEKAEYVDLFEFPGYGCCPVQALKNLKEKQIKAGVYDTSLPVFRFGNGRYLTMSQLNSTLSLLLADICVPGVSSITCHSFRAGIPSTLALFPELHTDDLIKGWGRWASDCYTRYTRLKLPQKQNIFQKISGALKTVHPLRGL